MPQEACGPVAASSRRARARSVRRERLGGSRLPPPRRRPPPRSPRALLDPATRDYSPLLRVSANGLELSGTTHLSWWIEPQVTGGRSNDAAEKPRVVSAAA